MANEWLLFGLILAGEFIFAVGLAALVRWMSIKGLHGQTLWMVVIGVAGTVSIAGPVIGWETVGKLAICFGVTGIPMAVEYLNRIGEEHEIARKTLEANLDEHPSTDR
jgi:mannose/fructose/N-acetylgalactosamine-specific phosphotransferase system component IIC